MRPERSLYRAKQEHQAPGPTAPTPPAPRKEDVKLTPPENQWGSQ